MDNILEALNYIKPSDLSYETWLSVGMALKQEGYDVSTWDNWSRNDSRYKEGVCSSKWRSFNGSSNPIGGGTIINLAKSYGYSPIKSERSMCMDWDDVIEYDGDGPIYQLENNEKPTEQLIKYLKTLFKDDEFVSYVSNDVWFKEEDNKYYPRLGSCDRTAAELIHELEKYPDDIGAVIGDTKPECGAWIRFNPVDGKGAKNDNVTRFTYALVESDDMPIIEQDALYRKFELPIACLVHSGGKSLHAIVKVEAKNAEEYRSRVDFLYDFLEKNGLKVDKANRNPSRLSRMPGVMRNGVMQTLVATNIGKRSWEEWKLSIDGYDDSLPPFIYPYALVDNQPELAPELIEGLLRIGHKMTVVGGSKTGKSWFLIKLGISLAEGLEFLEFQCKKCKVLYINLEIDGASFINRIYKVYKALGIERPTNDNLVVWNLRGKSMTLDKLAPIIINRVKDKGFSAIIIDPIYKVMMGDENSASDMGAFFNHLDRICTETKCATIIAHHHTKGAQGFKEAIDRGSGSGSFGRDPDTMIDITALELNNNVRIKIADSPKAKPMMLSFVTRDFETPEPIKVWFDFPLHKIDKNNLLKNCYPKGDPRNNLKQYKDDVVSTDDELMELFNLLAVGNNEVPIIEIAKYVAETSEEDIKVDSCKRKIYRWTEKDSRFQIKDGILSLKES